MCFYKELYPKRYEISIPISSYFVQSTTSDLVGQTWYSALFDQFTFFRQWCSSLASADEEAIPKSFCHLFQTNQ